MRSGVLVGLALGAVGFSAADSTSATATISASSTSTSSAAAQTHTVDVGKGGQFQFQPSTVNASAGDYITWNFYPGGHTVVRAAFKYPCIPSNMSTQDNDFFFSGNISPSQITDPLPQFTIKLNDTEPIFYYCSAPGSCINKYMIGVINPTQNETLDEQVSAAKDSSAIQLSPGDPYPTEGSNPFTTTGSASGTATSTSTPAATSTAASSSSGGSSLSAGAIAGIAIGGAAVVILAAALIYICGMRGGQLAAYRRSGHWGHSAPVEEARYGGGGGGPLGPRSPGQNTFGSSQYPHSPGQETFHAGGGPSPQHSPYAASPPPMSPGSHPAYGAFNQVHSPLMGGSDDGRGYYDHAPQDTPDSTKDLPAEAASPEPVELPSSNDPGNSPIPGYQPPMRQMSWAQGAESNYRPGPKN